MNGKEGVTPETAVSLGAALGTSPEFWLNLEAAYRLANIGPVDPAIAERARKRGKPVRLSKSNENRCTSTDRAERLSTVSVVSRPNVPDHDRRILQPRDDLLAIGREAECVDPGARRLDRLDLPLVPQPEDADEPPRRGINEVPTAMDCPSGENARRHTSDSGISISRRTWPVWLSSQTIVLAVSSWTLHWPA